MLKHLTCYVLLCLIQGYLLYDRDDVIAEFQPLLTERANNFTTEYNDAGTEYTLVISQIQNQTWAAVASVNEQIATLKTTISTDIAEATETDVVNCLSTQQTAANQLSSVAINSTCWVGITYADLEDARDALGVLAKIPNSTIAACGSLNPLPSQDQNFLNCVSHKILDLDEMNEVLMGTFAEETAQSLNSSVACLAEQNDLVAQQINNITFQVTLCMS